MTHDYDDIISLPHPVSKRFPQMSLRDRAAQFAPFAALNGHSDAIRETARITDAKIEISESTAEVLDRKILFLENEIRKNPVVSITYFIPDTNKKGGAYKTFTGKLTIIDRERNMLSFDTGEQISIHSIIDMESDILPFDI